MPVVKPLSRDQVEAAGLGEELEKAETLGVPDDFFFRIMAHVPPATPTR